MFRKIKKWILHYLINRENRRRPRVKIHLDFRDVRTIGVVFVLDNEAHYRELDRLVKNSIAPGKEVRMLGFFSGKVLPNFFIHKLNIDIVTHKDLNWLGFPKSDTAKEFIQRRFDLLMDFTSGELPACDYVTGMSKAHFKAGAYREEMVSIFDLMIKKTPEMDFRSFIQSMTRYLSILKTRK